MLELHAAAIVARKPKKNPKKLIPFADEIARAVKSEDIRLYLHADRNYHQLLTEAADDPRPTEMVMGLRDQMRLYGIKSRAGLARQNESAAEHYQIIETPLRGQAHKPPATVSELTGSEFLNQSTYRENNSSYIPRGMRIRRRITPA